MCHLEIVFGYSRAVEALNNHGLEKLGVCFSGDKQLEAGVVGPWHPMLHLSFPSAVLNTRVPPFSKSPHAHKTAAGF